MKIEYIEIDDYNSLIAIDLFSTNEFSRKFGKFNVKNVIFKLAWRSDIIVPEIKYLTQNYLFVGIDNSIVVINLNTSEIIVKLVLQWNFIEIKSTIGYFYIITEQSIITFSLSNFTITSYNDFPDIIESVEIIKNELQVLCMDGDSYTVIIN